MIRSIGELPFVERPARALLGLEHGGDAIDTDYAGFGWAVVDALDLADPRGVETVRGPLVLALHGADDGPAWPDDVELEFALDGRYLTAPLSRFLATWLPRLPRTDAVVLAMCNPHRASLPALVDRPLRYGLGPVDSWLDETGSPARLRLTADAWRSAPALEAS